MVDRDWFQCFKLNYDESPLNFAFNFNLRRYTTAVKQGWHPPAASKDMSRSKSLSNIAKGKVTVDYTDTTCNVTRK